MNEQPLRILYLAAEVEPFARTGGLAEVAGALPRALNALGHDVRVSLPRYGHIDPSRWDLRSIVPDYPVSLGSRQETARVLEGSLPDSSVPVWFIDQPSLFGSPEVYLGEPDAERFIFWTRAILEALRQMDWVPDIIHANEWHAAIVPNLLRTSLRSDPLFQKTASVYTIHNLAYRGVFGQRILEIAGVAEFGFVTHPGLPELHRVVDLMSRGIYYADIINTVSPTHAQEILKPECGEGLDLMLRDRRDRLFGVLNGVDPHRYNPNSTEYGLTAYSVENLAGKGANKTLLQRLMGLAEEPQTPLFCFIGRLNDQKGLGLLREALELVLAHHQAQIIFVGTGEERYHDWINHAQAQFPMAIRACFTFNDELLHQCYAGSDALLMPSLIEPGGTNQLIALRYGTLPLVRATGGLKDTVEDINHYQHRGTGFVFHEPAAQALYGTLVRALETFRHPEIWQGAMKRAMAADWSWQRAAMHYTDLYHRALTSRLARRPRSSYRAL